MGREADNVKTFSCRGLSLPPIHIKNFTSLKTWFTTKNIAISLVFMFIFGLHLEIWSETFLYDSIMKGPFFSSSKGNKHGRWEVGKLTFTTILTHFHRFCWTGTFKNICLSRGADKNGGGWEGKESLSKDGNIFKRAAAAAATAAEPVAARPGSRM